MRAVVGIATMKTNFTMGHYKKTLESYIDSGWVFDDVSLRSENKSIIMAHDVDHDILNCINLINAENEMGVTATYFLRLHARSYNMLCRSSISIAKELLELGAKIGLHYEPTFCPCESKYSHHIVKQMDTLSEAIGSEVSYFNIHEPARTKVDLSGFLPNKNRCYNSSFFKDYKYLSDSSCRWREGCFSEHVDRWDRLLVLTHPMWWYNSYPDENY